MSGFNILNIYNASNEIITTKISFILENYSSESKSQRFYIEIDRDYSINVNDVKIKAEGSTADRWGLAWETSIGIEPSIYSDASIGIDVSIVASDKKYFWINASALDTEDPGTDNSVTIIGEGAVED